MVILFFLNVTIPRILVFSKAVGSTNENNLTLVNLRSNVWLGHLYWAVAVRDVLGTLQSLNESRVRKSTKARTLLIFSVRKDLQKYLCVLFLYPVLLSVCIKFLSNHVKEKYIEPSIKFV